MTQVRDLTFNLFLDQWALSSPPPPDLDSSLISVPEKNKTAVYGRNLNEIGFLEPGFMY